MRRSSPHRRQLNEDMTRKPATGMAIAFKEPGGRSGYGKAKALLQWPALLFLSVFSFALQAESPDRVSSQNSHVTASEIKTLSDAELTQLTALWAELSPTERRILIHEVRSRMDQAKPGVKPRVKVQRRYGRIVRKPDGSVVVQTTIVPTQTDTTEAGAPADPSQRKVGDQSSGTLERRARGRATITFGFGFERRQRAQAQNPERTTSGSADQSADVRAR